jgi:integrase
MLDRACWQFGQYEFEELRPEHIGAWRAEMPAPTRWQATQAIRQVASWAVRWEFASRNPFEHVPNPRPLTREVAIFPSWDEVERVSDALHGSLRLLPIIGAGCGLRPGELLGLSWRDIDINGARLTVRHRVVDGAIVEGGKTRRSRRTVQIRERVVQALLHAREADDDRLIFRTRSGSPYDLRNLRKRAWRPALAVAGLAASYRMYDLRHTYAAWSLRAGVSAYQLSRRMGTSLAMIDATYGHLVADADEHERSLLDTWDQSYPLVRYSTNGYGDV